MPAGVGQIERVEDVGGVRGGSRVALHRVSAAVGVENVHRFQFVGAGVVVVVGVNEGPDVVGLIGVSRCVGEDGEGGHGAVGCGAPS